MIKPGGFAGVYRVRVYRVSSVPPSKSLRFGLELEILRIEIERYIERSGLVSRASEKAGSQQQHATHTPLLYRCHPVVLIAYRHVISSGMYILR